MKASIQVTILMLLTILLNLVQCREKNYYDTLEIKKDASHDQIRKAYRRLPLKYHPDRNKGNEEESSERFREVGTAYEVLSNENSRGDYDRSLRYGTYDPSRGSGWSAGHHREYRDPFEQFNNLFKNDPFFRDAFKEMDGLFDNLFSGDNELFQKTSNTGGGRTHTTKTNSNNNGGNSRSKYASRSTRTLIQNGQLVIIKSLEKDGKKIDEKYIDDKLIERRISLEKDGNKIEEIYKGEKLIIRKINGVLGQIDTDNNNNINEEDLNEEL